MRLLAAIAGLLLPASAHAQGLPVNLNDVVCLVSGPLCGITCFGPQCVTLFASIIIEALKPLVGLIATLVIVRAGFTLVYRGSEEELGRAKRGIAAALTAIALIFLAPALVDMFYGGYRTGTAGGVLANPGSGAVILNAEIFGFIQWITVLVAVAAVLVIIVSGVRAIGTFGSEEGVTQLKRTVGGVIGGILLLIFTQAIVQTFGLEGGAPSAIPVILRAVQVINAVLLLATLIAVAVVVYAGITMIVFVGNEDKFGAAKSLIIRVLIGIAIILVSWVILNFAIAVIAG